MQIGISTASFYPHGSLHDEGFRYKRSVTDKLTVLVKPRCFKLSKDVCRSAYTKFCITGLHRAGTEHCTLLISAAGEIGRASCRERV